MLFDSPAYLVALVLVVLLYWRLRHGGQNNFLLAFSYFFYGWWDWRFLWLIALSTVVDYFFARAIEVSHDRAKRNWVLAVSVSINLGFLGLFKYYNFFADSLHVLLLQLGIESNLRILEIVLPPGISFYTFQAIAYMVDVHQRRIPPVRSLRDYALFISLFPHLIAGPIQRPDHLIPQVQTDRRFDATSFGSGVMLIINGLFRKCVIADQCAILANAAFSGAFGPRDGFTTLLGAYAFAWQIYGDFSGYSNIARGSAQLLGFHFMVNFRQPYLSESIQEFWRRWHISLSTWLRDYLYIGLGGNRLGTAKTYRNLFLTMLIGGFWHGANWTFVIWGALHGGWLALERALGIERRPDTPNSLAGRWARRWIVFNLVCVAWIFFRAADVSGAGAMLAALGHWQWQPALGPAFAMLVAFAVPLLLLDLLEARREEEYLGEHASLRTRMALAAVMTLATLLLAAPENSAFIYFQF
jgi:alginate O-acetyltransferase complex protein AlgI